MKRILMGAALAIALQIFDVVMFLHARNTFDRWFYGFLTMFLIGPHILNYKSYLLYRQSQIMKLHIKDIEDEFKARA